MQTCEEEAQTLEGQIVEEEEEAEEEEEVSSLEEHIVGKDRCRRAWFMAREVAWDSEWFVAKQVAWFMAREVAIEVPWFLAREVECLGLGCMEELRLG